MGLHDDITSDIAKAFNTTLADAVKPITIIHEQQTHDAETGVPDIIQTTVETRGVVEPVTDDMLDGEVIQITDTSFTILKDELDYLPLIADKIIVGTDIYSVNAVLIDPADVAFIIIGRNV